MSGRNFMAEARIASGLNILFGACLIVSPWVFGYQATGLAATWNSVIVGTLIAILAAINCFSKHIYASPNWMSVILAPWITLSPLVYGYAANPGGFGDNLLLYLLIVGCAVSSDNAATIGEKQRRSGTRGGGLGRNRRGATLSSPRCDGHHACGTHAPIAACSDPGLKSQWTMRDAVCWLFNTVATTLHACRLRPHIIRSLRR